MDKSSSKDIGTKMDKKMRKGRGIDHTWKILRFKGDMGYYAKCKCEFIQNGITTNQPGTAIFEFAPGKLYRYCPSCGAKKKWFTDVERVDKEMWEYMR